MPTLILQQLEAPRPGDLPRRLELSGAAAPTDQIRWGVRQRGTKRHYPGSGKAAVHLDGPEELEPDLAFDWKSRVLGERDALLDGNPVGNADDLVATVEDFVRDQALVRLEWRERSLVGYLAELIPVEGRESEYTATLTFDPTESPRWERSARPTPETPPESLATEFQANFADPPQSPISAPRRLLEAVESALDEVNVTVRRFGELASEIQQTGETVGQIYRGTGEILATFVEQAADLRDAVTEPAGAIAQTDDPLAQMEAARYRRGLSESARKTRHRAASERTYYRAIEGREILGVHTVKAGETLWAISWRWYGTTELWKLIATRNGVAATSPPAGTRLQIPRREAA